MVKEVSLMYPVMCMQQALQPYEAKTLRDSF
jgi:hypothetical protein